MDFSKLGRKVSEDSIEIKADTGADRKRYLAALQKADDGNYEPLETLISTALAEMLKRIYTSTTQD